MHADYTIIPHYLHCGDMFPGYLQHDHREVQQQYLNRSQLAGLGTCRALPDFFFILSEADSHFHKHMHQLQNPLISIMFCHKSHSWPVSLTVIIAEQEAEVCD